MSDDTVERWLAMRAQEGLEAAVIVNALRGERRIGRAQQKIINNTKYNYEELVRQAANTIIRHRSILSNEPVLPR